MGIPEISVAYTKLTYSMIYKGKFADKGKRFMILYYNDNYRKMNAAIQVPLDASEATLTIAQHQFWSKMKQALEK